MGRACARPAPTAYDSMRAVRYTGELRRTGGNTAGFLIPDDVVEALRGGLRPKVVVTVDGYSWRSSIANMGDEFCLGVSMSHRAASGLQPGQRYAVDLELDTAPRVVEVPRIWRRRSMRRRGHARHGIGSSSPTSEHADAIATAKKPETRGRRIDTCLEMLAATH